MTPEKKDRGLITKVAKAITILTEFMIELKAAKIDGGDDVKEITVDLNTGKIKFVTEL